MSRILSFSAAVFLCLFVSACSGDSSSPTAPSPPAAQTKIIAIDGTLGFGDVVLGQSKDLTLTIRNTGTASLTLGDPTASASIASLLTSATGSQVVSPGGSTSMLVRFSPTAAGSVSGTVTIAGDHTGGTNTIAMSGTGISAQVSPPTQQVFTLAGVISEAGRGGVSGVTVRVSEGQYVGKSSTTDGNGYYSISGVKGVLRLSATKTGYVNSSQSTPDVSRDTRFDFTMLSEPIVPPAGVRVGATCKDGTSSDATGQGACSSHGGVACWKYSDKTCRAQ